MNASSEDNAHSGSTRHLRARWAAALVALLLSFAGVQAYAQSNSIEQVNVTRGASGRTIVRFTLKAPPANPPAGFSIANPPRIALDFLDTGSALTNNQRTVDDPTLRSLNLVQAGNRTRVVFNLNKPQTFETAVEGNSVLVTLADTGAGGAAEVTGQVQRFAEAHPGDVQHALRDVDFRRGRNGEGRIIVDLSDNGTGIDIRQQGRTLVVDFMRTSLPRNLERRLDVADFNTPVTSIDTFAQGGNTRMVIEPKGLWEHSAYQADNKFIVEIKPIQEDPNKLVQGTRGGYKGEKLSLNFQNIEVRAVLQVIADFTGLNIITSDTVNGSLTLRLKDVPWDQALDIILQTKGLDMRKNGNIVLIAPREELAIKERQQLEAQAQISDLEPLQTELFQLNYAKAADILNIVGVGKGAGQGSPGGGDARFLSRRGTAFVDPRTNILFVTDIPSKLEEVRRIIRQIDTTIRQVLIEARIVIADDTFSRQLGVRFGQQTGLTFNNRHYAVGSGGSLNTQPVVHTEGDRIVRDTRTQTPFELASGLASAGYSDSNQLNVNLPVTNPAGQLALTLINLGSGNLINLELSALEADNRGKVVSSPRVITADNQKAQIEQGTEIPYVTPGSANSPATVQFKKAVLRLDVTPQITPDNRIIMTVEIRKDSVGQFVQLGGGFSVPSIDTKNVTTQIAVNNGDTAVIGGIYEETIRNDATKVPLLGDIPVLGYLFKQTGRSSEKTELLIFLTPRIVRESVTAVK
ncbi:MAG TPA: type IV pilus secretin PilQ [Casimicrobiaceae bacterium]|jgi:type IV pilus assembly protein PilQ|nr:type IV pilus secretin PilQ [Casimicrobiaceae bacterium]